MTNIVKFELCGFDESFEGVNHGSWNGWACPLFTLQEAKRLTNHINSLDCGLVGSYNEQTKSFSFDDTNADFLEFFEETEKNGAKGYAIGAFSWCWTIEEDTK
jgi:hypothetical protein